MHRVQLLTRLARVSRTPRYFLSKPSILSPFKASFVHSASTIDQSVKPSTSSSPPLDFNDTQMAYSSKSVGGILLALSIYKLCSWNWFVDNSEKLYELSTRLLGERLVEMLVRPTFFQHFCAGVDEASIKPTIALLQKHGVGGILDYAAEADVEDEGNNDKVAPEDAMNHSVGVYEARVYSYTTEVACDTNAEIFRSAIKSVHNVLPEGFAAIKITALGNPLLLERISSAWTAMQSLFRGLDKDGDGLIYWKEFQHRFPKHFRSTIDEEHLRQLFVSLVGGAGESLDLETTFINASAWRTREIPSKMIKVKSVVQDCLEDAANESDFNAVNTFLSAVNLDAEELDLFHKMAERIEGLVSFASELNVRLMIDAEHSYFQAAIDAFCLDMMRRYNTDPQKGPIVFNTYQCYLKETPEKLDHHIQCSEEEGWIFAAKLVRGAYMVLERERAESMDYPCPVHDCIEDTHDCYNTCAHRIITRNRVKQGKELANILIASHNQDSIEIVVDIMQQHYLQAASSNVYFGQLLGMSDHLTFCLGQAGYKAYKYVPYGPVHEVMPYLIRRVQENSAMVLNTAAQRKMLTKELMRRAKATVGMSS